MKRSALVLALLSAFAFPILGQLNRGPSTGQSRWPLVGDINGDGLDDVVDMNGVQFNAGGKLLDPVPLGIPGGVLDLLDVNGDHFPDLLVSPDGPSVHPMPPYTVRINDGLGNFPTAFVLPYVGEGHPGPGPLWAPFIGDVDGDGKDDLITYYYPAGGGPGLDFTFYHSNGDGTFEKRGTTAVAYPELDIPSFRQHMVFGDLNGDHHPDMVLRAHDALIVLYGHGDGTFDAPLIRYLPYLEYGQSGLQLADVDGDGNLDVLYGDRLANLHVFFGDGAGHFTRTAAAAMGDPFGGDDNYRSITVLHYSSPTRYDIVTGARTNLVVLLTYSNGSLHEVSRVKMADYPPEEQMVFNVFGGKFRSNTARDIYVFEGGWWRAMPSSLVFADGAATAPARGRSRIVARPPAEPSAAVQPFTLKVSQVGCVSTEEIWQLQREGAFAETKTADGRLIQAYFDPQGAINYRITGDDSFKMWGKLVPTWANRYMDGGAHSEVGSGTNSKLCLPGTIHTDAVVQ